MTSGRRPSAMPRASAWCGCSSGGPRRTAGPLPHRLRPCGTGLPPVGGPGGAAGSPGGRDRSRSHTCEAQAVGGQEVRACGGQTCPRARPAAAGPWRPASARACKAAGPPVRPRPPPRCRRALEGALAHGSARQGAAGHGSARQGTAVRSGARRCAAGRGGARQGAAVPSPHLAGVLDPGERHYAAGRHPQEPRPVLCPGAAVQQRALAVDHELGAGGR